jgi:hypothetical protein
MAKPEEAKPHQLAFAEPALPALPALAYVYPPTGSKSIAGDTALAANRPAASSPQLSVGKTAARSADAGASQKADSHIKAVPVLRRKVFGTFGHAPDNSWLQGRVLKSTNGHWELTFCECPTDARCGGRVLLEDDARFEQIRDGDVIQVEGTLPSSVLTPGIPGLEAPAIYRVDRMSCIR